MRSLVFDALGVNGERAYKNTPFAWSPGAPSRSGWGLFVHTPATVTHAVGSPLWSQRSYAIAVDDPALDLFIFAGDDGADLLRVYTDLTGRAPVPPYWSLGAILSKAYYRTAEEILDAAREVRRARHAVRHHHLRWARLAGHRYAVPFLLRQEALSRSEASFRGAEGARASRSVSGNTRSSPATGRSSTTWPPRAGC